MFPQPERRALPMRRRRVLALPLCVALAPMPLLAQEVLPLRPNEPIDFPGGSFTLLGLDIQRTQGTAVAMRVRVQAGPKEQVPLRDPTFRLLAAGVPRQPSAYPIENVAVDSALDFDLAFNIPDRSDDLVLQLRFGDVVLRRRLPKR